MHSEMVIIVDLVLFCKCLERMYHLFVYFANICYALKR